MNALNETENVNICRCPSSGGSCACMCARTHAYRCYPVHRYCSFYDIAGTAQQLHICVAKHGSTKARHACLAAAPVAQECLSTEGLGPTRWWGCAKKQPTRHRQEMPAESVPCLRQLTHLRPAAQLCAAQPHKAMHWRKQEPTTMRWRAWPGVLFCSSQSGPPLRTQVFKRTPWA